MLSIIIPTLNEEKYLPLLLKSIRAQDFKNYEIVVSDAGSEDRTEEIAKRYRCKVVQGGLPAKGRNQGAKAANGDLLLFLDAEVFLPENFLSEAMSEFRKRNLDAAGCGLEPVQEKWMPKFFSTKFGYDLFYNWPARLLENVFPYAASFIVVKKEIHEKLNGFDEGIKISEDHDYVRRASKIGKFGILKFSKLPLFLRRFRKEGIMKVGLKYAFCNLFNISLGEVRTDIFRYHFGQYKHIDFEEMDDSKKPNFILQFLWIAAGCAVIVFGLIAWLAVFIVFTPKFIALQFRKF